MNKQKNEYKHIQTSIKQALISLKLSIGLT